MSKGIDKQTSIEQDIRAGRASFSKQEMEWAIRRLKQWQHMARFNGWRDSNGDKAGDNVNFRD